MTPPNLLNRLLADLVVELTGPDKVGTGEDIVYNVKVSNIGLLPVTNISFRFDVPDGLAYHYGPSPAYSLVSSGSSIFGFHRPGGSLWPGGSDTASIAVVAPSMAGRVTVNVAVDVTHVVTESSETNNTDTLTTEVQLRPDMKTQVVGAATATIGHELLYDARIQNIGPGPATNISGWVKASLGDVRLPNVINTHGFRFTRADTWIWQFDGGTLAGGGSFAFPFWVKPQEATVGGAWMEVCLTANCSFEDTKAMSDDEAKKLVKLSP